MQQTRFFIALTFLILLSSVFPAFSQRISKKITANGEGKFNAPLTIGKGFAISITFNDITIVAELTISETDFQAVVEAKSGTITSTPFVVTLAPGDYVLKEKYYGQVGATRTLIPMPPLEIPEIFIERPLSVQTLTEYEIELATTVYNLRAKVLGDFEGDTRIRETVGTKVTVPFRSTRKLKSGKDILYQAEFSAYAASETKISSRPLMTPEVHLGLSPDSGIQVSWVEMEDAVSYQVYRSASAITDVKGFVPIAMGVEKTTFIDQEADLNTVYYYAVTAVGAGDEVRETAIDSPNGILLTNESGGAAKYADGTQIIFQQDAISSQPVVVFIGSLDIVPEQLMVQLDQAISDHAHAISVLDQNNALVKSFNPVVSLTLSYSSTAADATLTPQIYALQGNQWIRLLDQQVDTEKNTVTADITGSGIYRLASVVLETVEPTDRPWDVNGDNSINIFDLVLVASEFGKSGGNLEGDINGDSSVDIFDLVLVASHFGETYGTPAAPSIVQSINPRWRLSVKAIPMDNPIQVNLQIILDNTADLDLLAGYQLSFDSPIADLVIINADQVFSPRKTYVMSAHRNQNRLTVGAVAYGTATRPTSIDREIGGDSLLLEAKLNVTGDLNQALQQLTIDRILLSDTQGRAIPVFLNPEIDLTAIQPPAFITAVKQNYPNPFNPETWIPFTLSEATTVRMKIYDTAGLKIREIDLGFVEAGNYSEKGQAIYWDGRNQSGERVASGTYFYRLQTDHFSQTKKMIILK